MSRSDYINCICGYHGSGSNCSEQRFKPKCEGCGFDRETYKKRMEALRQQPLKEVGLPARGRLLRDWGVRTQWELWGWMV
jgi:hypothetical protein